MLAFLWLTRYGSKTYLQANLGSIGGNIHPRCVLIFLNALTHTRTLILALDAYPRMGVCVSLSGYAFRHALRYWAKTWRGMVGGGGRDLRAYFRSDPIKGHPEVKLP